MSATDIAELGFAVNSDPVKKASDELNKLTPAADKAEKAVDQFSKSATNASRAAEGMGSAVGKVTALLATAFSIDKLIKYTNTWTDLNSRVVIATGSLAAGALTMERLSEMARRTYSSLELTAQTFLLNANAMKALGYNTGQTLDFVEAINDALVVSGAKGDVAASVINALSKAMALGKLSGDQLETVLASGGRVAQALADSMGVSVLQLRALGSQGKITGKEIFGITGELEKLRKEADSMPATIGDALGQLDNAILKTVGKYDQLSGASNVLGQAILFVADNIELFIPALVGIAAAIAAATLAAIAGTAAFGAFTAALLTNPIVLATAAIAALAAGVTALVLSSNNAAIAGAKFNAAIDENATALSTAAKASGVMRTQLAAQIEMQKAAAQAALEEADAQTIASRAKLASMQADAKGKWVGYNAIGIAMQTNDVNQKTDTSVALDSAYQSLVKQSDQIQEIIKKYGSSTVTIPAAIDPKAEKAAQKMAERYDDLIQKSQQYISQQNLEAQALGQSADETTRLTHEQELLNQAANDNINLTPAMRDNLISLADQMAEAENSTRRLTAIYDEGKSVVTGFFSDLNSELMNGTSVWGAFANAAINALTSIGNKLIEQASGGLWDMLFSAGSSLLGGGFGGFSASTFAKLPTGTQNWLKSAQGNVFGGDGLSAHRNTVVSQPTVFKFAQGGMGVMGETPNSPSEAIVPLKRTSKGDLGVAISDSNNKQAPAQYIDNRQYHIDARGAQKGVGQEVADAISAYDKMLPDRMNQINNDPRKRAA